MTGPRPPGSPPPPDWFLQAQRARARQELAEREQAQREQAKRDQARREEHRRAALVRQQAEQVQTPRQDQARQDQSRLNQSGLDAPAGTRSNRYGQPGRQVHGPVRQNATPWIGAPPGAMFPAVEDATMLIQRITDEAVRGDVREAATVIHQPAHDSSAPDQPDLPDQKYPGRHYPADRDPVSGHRYPPPGPAGAPATAAADVPPAVLKTATTAGVVRAGALMAIATVVSRLTGLASKAVMLTALGLSITSNAYTIANTLPNIVFELLIGGVLTSVAIPLLTRAQRSDADGGQEYTQRLLTIAVVGLLIATVASIFCAPLLAQLYSGSAAGDRRVVELTTQLGRLLLPQIFFYGIAALFGAILNTKERFAANAWAPALNNVVVIVVAAFLYLDTHGKGSLVNGLPARDLLILGLGTTAGIVLQAVVMIPSLRRSGFRFRWRWGWDPRLTTAGGLVGWAVVYVLTSQVGVVVTTRVATNAFASKSGYTTFSYAALLFQMPYGILGVAVLTAIMPRLSRHAAEGKLDEVKDDVSLANRLSAVALLPVSAGLIVLGTSVSVVLFRHGQVTFDGAQQIGLTVAGMAIGLVPLAMTLVQMRVFYAMQDGRTPTIINGIMVAVRVPLLLASSMLAPRWIIPGLALATAASYLVGAVVGELWLRARFGRMGTTRTLRTIGKMLIASAFGAGAALAAVYYAVGLNSTTWLDAVKSLIVGGLVGLVVITIYTTALRVEELAPLRNRVLRLLGRNPAAGGATIVTPATASEPVTATTPAGMGGSNDSSRSSIRPRSSTSPNSSISPRSSISRKQVTERVTHPSAGGPRENAEDPNAPSPGGLSDGDRTVHLKTGQTGSAPTGGQPVVELAPGATIGSRYRLVSLVATDDAGNRFWRAKDTVLPRDMAVTLLPDTNATSATVARTLRVGRLHHIGLPQTLDVGTEQGQSYVVGQWVDGATLTDLVAGGPLEPDVATSITAKVAEAVAEAHRNGIALGAINPSLVRVNFDGQVRLSHVIAHGSATPDQDIRAVGGLLYLMLTGAWPISAGAGSMNDATGRFGATSSGVLIQAPTRRGREVPAHELRSGVPTALSALAERALHPEDADGIHAVGAISSLLRQPEVAPVHAVRADEPVRPALNPSERRLVRERRVKLGIASAMILAFSALIIIVVASLSKQVLASVAGPTVNTVQKLTVAPVPTTRPTATRPKPTPSKTRTTATSGASTTASPTTATTTSPPAAPPATVQKIGQATVYDPGGDGVKDNPDQAAQAFDGNPQTGWSTFVYKQQFPTLKPGVGLMLAFDAPIKPASVTVSSESPDTTIEIRSSTAQEPSYEQTTALAQGHIAAAAPGAPGSVTIALVNAPKSQYLVVFVVHTAADGSKFRSVINEISVSGTP